MRTQDGRQSVKRNHASEECATGEETTGWSVGLHPADVNAARETADGGGGAPARKRAMR